MFLGQTVEIQLKLQFYACYNFISTSYGPDILQIN